MMPEDGLFKELYQQAFPSVSPSLRARFSSFLASNSLDHKWMYSANLRDDLSQGDVCYAIPAFFFSEGDVRKSPPCPFILLQHTCDMSVDGETLRNKNYVFAPLFPLEMVEKYLDSDAIKKNFITHKVCLVSIPGIASPHVVDLNMIGNIDSGWLHASIKSGDIKRLASLSDSGFYFLLAKLTAHLLRAH